MRRIVVRRTPCIPRWRCCVVGPIARVRPPWHVLPNVPALSSRPVTTDESPSASVTTMRRALRRFYRMVHPDHFEGHPEAQRTNQESFQALQGYMDALNDATEGRPCGDESLRSGDDMHLCFYLHALRSATDHEGNDGDDGNEAAAADACTATTATPVVDPQLATRPDPCVDRHTNGQQQQQDSDADASAVQETDPVDDIAPADVSAPPLRRVVAQFRSSPMNLLNPSQQLMEVEQALRDLFAQCGLGDDLSGSLRRKPKADHPSQYRGQSLLIFLNDWADYAKKRMDRFHKLDREMGLIRMVLSTAGIRVGYADANVSQEQKLALLEGLPRVIDAFPNAPWKGVHVIFRHPHEYAIDGFGRIHLDAMGDSEAWKAIVAGVDWDHVDHLKRGHEARVQLERKVAASMGLRAVCGERDDVVLGGSYMGFLHRLDELAGDDASEVGAQMEALRVRVKPDNLILMATTGQHGSLGYDVRREANVLCVPVSGNVAHIVQWVTEHAAQLSRDLKRRDALLEGEGRTRMYTKRALRVAGLLRDASVERTHVLGVCQFLQARASIFAPKLQGLYIRISNGWDVDEDGTISVPVNVEV